MKRPRILIIPKNGESYILPTLRETAKAFGVTALRLQHLIEDGDPIHFKGETYCFDYVAEDAEFTKFVSALSRRPNGHYICTSGDRRLEFSSYKMMSIFFHHSNNWGKALLDAPRPFKDDSGNTWTMEVIYDRA